MSARHTAVAAVAAVPATAVTPEPTERARRTLRMLRIGAVVAVLVLLAVAFKLGLLQVFSDPARVRHTLVALGPWGYAAFLGAYTLLQPFGVPGTVFVVAAPLIWPWPVAYALSMVGTLSASVVGFAFARFVARDQVAKMLPKRFRAYDAALEKRAFATVFTLRFIFWMPPLLHAFFGVSRVRFWTHFWGSAAGYALPLLVVSYFGQRAFDALRTASPATWAAVAGGTAAFVLMAWLARRWMKQRTEVGRTGSDA